MVIGMRNLPRGVYSVSYFVVREGSIESAAIPLVQGLIGLEAINKVRVRTEIVSASPPH
jgi:hypothetical protein